MTSKQNTEQTFDCIRRATILRFLSYAYERIEADQVITLIPEAAILHTYFRGKTLHRWRECMQRHNAKLEKRKKTMQVLCTFSRLHFASLDSFMTAVHGDLVAEAVRSLIFFGEKMTRKIERHPDAMIWVLEYPILISRRRWAQLRRQCLTLATRLLDVCNQIDQDSWPSQSKLLASAARLRAVYSSTLSCRWPH